MEDVTRYLDGHFAYLDDVLIASKTPEDPVCNLRVLFQYLQDRAIVVNRLMNFLGHTISKHGNLLSENQIQSIIEISRPPTLQPHWSACISFSFWITQLGQNPLTVSPKERASKTSHLIVWAAFKECNSLEILLVEPMPETTISITVDALGTVLQHHRNMEILPLAIFSQSLQVREQWYCTFRKELLIAYLAPRGGWAFSIITYSQFTADICHTSSTHNTAVNHFPACWYQQYGFNKVQSTM